MLTVGLLVRFEAIRGKETEVEAFLRDAEALVREEPGTAAWFAVRFGRSEFGIFDAFRDAAARDAHLNGAVAKELFGQVGNIVHENPTIQKVELLAEKWPAAPPAAQVRKAILLTLKSQEGHAADIEKFLLDGKPIVDEEPDTIAWFAFKIDADHYAIFDVFPDNGGRFAHLTGHVPRELAKQALTLLGGFPDLELLDVLAARIDAAG